MLIFGERHLRRVLAGYAAHYNVRRPHRALRLRPPRPTSPVPEPVRGSIRRRPILGWGSSTSTRRQPETAGQAPWPHSGTLHPECPQATIERVDADRPGHPRRRVRVVEPGRPSSTTGGCRPRPSSTGDRSPISEGPGGPSPPEQDRQLVAARFDVVVDVAGVSAGGADDVGGPVVPEPPEGTAGIAAGDVAVVFELEAVVGGRVVQHRYAVLVGGALCVGDVKRIAGQPPVGAVVPGAVVGLPPEVPELRAQGLVESQDGVVAARDTAEV